MILQLSNDTYFPDPCNVNLICPSCQLYMKRARSLRLQLSTKPNHSDYTFLYRCSRCHGLTNVFLDYKKPPRGPFWHAYEIIEELE